MADKGFNGSTFTFGGAIAKLRSISHDATGAKVNIAGADDDRELYVAGLPDDTFTVEVVGGSSIAVGDLGAVSITWNDGTGASIGNSMCVGASTKGSKNGEILTTLTFAPTDATA